MDKNELLRLLDLEGQSNGGTSSLQIAQQDVPSPEVASPTALALDQWGLARGQEVLGESDRLKAHKLDANEVADFFGASFEPSPELVEKCTDPDRLNYLKTLMETPDYQALHTDTCLDVTASEIAAAHFGEQWGALKKGKEERKKKKNPSPKKGKGGVSEEMKEEMACLRACGKALEGAKQEVEDFREASAAFGLGQGASSTQDPQRLAQLYRRIKNDPRLKRICELAGKYRRYAQSKQRQKTTHGMDDMVGVNLSSDLGKILPHELAKIALPEFEDDVMRRLVEAQVMSREYRAVEPIAKGPIMVSVDESGSMAGEKGYMAKGLALAMAWIARKQKRWIGLIAFSGGTEGRILAMPPNNWNELALMEWLIQFYGGGTTMDVPIAQMPGYFESMRCPRGRTDYLLITDAICHVPPPMAEAFMAWKAKEKVKVSTLVIDGQPGDLAALSDSIHMVASLGLEEVGVQQALSI